jgi:D-sedoheptulose 7-phosphate isomerase
LSLSAAEFFFTIRADMKRGLSLPYFPNRLISDAGSYADEYFQRLATAAATVDRRALTAAGTLVAETIENGRRIYSCGNGGSAAVANHLVCDCVKGIRTGTDIKPKVHSLSTTVELLTAIVNDIGSEEMFSFQLESMGERGDSLIAISSSGSSPNIVRTIQTAKRMGICTIAMTGFTGGQSRLDADVSLHVDCANYGVIEDVHQSLMHILAQYTRHCRLIDGSELGRVKF